MAEVSSGNEQGGKKGKGKPHREQLRVDFTPMVDMNMLLITFFMFCTTLSKPQIMNLVVPSKDNKEILKDDEKPKTQADRTTTVILGGGDSIYYYSGKTEDVYKDYTLLKVTNYAPDGLRAVLVDKNGAVIKEVADLRDKRAKEQISEQTFQDGLKKAKDANGEGQVVIIKPTVASTYENLVNVLDEMQICSIGTYAIVDMTDGDNFVVQNYYQNGALSAKAPKK